MIPLASEVGVGRPSYPAETPFLVAEIAQVVLCMQSQLGEVVDSAEVLVRLGKKS